MPVAARDSQYGTRAVGWLRQWHGRHTLRSARQRPRQAHGVQPGHGPFGIVHPQWRTSVAGLLAAFQYCTDVGVNPRGWTVGVGWIDRLRVSGCIHTLEFLRRPVAEGGVQASSIVYLLKEVGESVG